MIYTDWLGYSILEWHRMALAEPKRLLGVGLPRAWADYGPYRDSRDRVWVSRCRAR